MSMTKIQIFLNKELPRQYTNLELLGDESPVASIDELCTLYNNKYASFGTLEIHIFDSKSSKSFIESLNLLFEASSNPIRVDEVLLSHNIHKFTPLIVVDGEIVSRGVYSDLTTLRGGKNSVSRGCAGGHCQH
jgi:hypothetical protein